MVGVAGVHNLLKVRPARLVPDEEIRQAITVALARDPCVGHLAVGVGVHGGQALLTGRVNTHIELEHAGEVAAGASGVLAVNNRLQVGRAATETEHPSPFPVPGDAPPEPEPLTPGLALTARIRAHYCWSTSLHNQNVAVLVENGRATPTRIVATWLDRAQAAFNANEAGAQHVDNELLLSAASES